MKHEIDAALYEMIVGAHDLVRTTQEYAYAVNAPFHVRWPLSHAQSILIRLVVRYAGSKKQT